MGRLGRGRPIPVTIVNPASRAFRAATGLGVFATTAAFPALDVTSPSVTVALPPLATAAAFPGLTVDHDALAALPPFATTAAFPPLIADVPILPGALIDGPFQIEWARTVFGRPPYYILSVEGWDDLPEVDSGNAPRSSRHGSWPGRDWAQQRVVSVVLAVSDTHTGFPVARRDLRRILSISEDGAEFDLVVRTDVETLRARGKVGSRIVPAEHFGQGFTSVAVRWTCADPRRYDLQQQSVTVAVGGSDFCVNNGDIGTSPLIKITGPVSNPVLHNEALDRTLRLDLAIGDGDELVIDTHAGTVTVNGDDRMDALSTLSVPVEEWILPAGTSRITYATASGGLPAELLFSSAYL